jgi:hypothetical protein
LIRVTDNLWVGNSSDGQKADVDIVFNVAVDLLPKLRYPSVEYVQVGLVDGPGNPLSAYCGAILTLTSLMEKDKKVLVYCHEGKSRSVVVALMYLNLVGGQRRSNPTAWSHWAMWDEMCVEGLDLSKVHPAHIEAFNKMPWGLLEIMC